MNTKNFNIHITYDKNLTLKELSDLLNRVNLSINDYYRDNGISNNTIWQYSPIVNKVGNGSILLNIGVTVLSDVTSTLLAEYIINRITKWRKSKNDNVINNIYIEAGDNNVINIHIAN